ncbi:MAG: flagellin FliC [Bdellovibrionales bacterium]|nr:flagellin FliC [Bdellovibrionales bacterium]
MGLRIQTNIASVNAQRNLRTNSAGLEKAMERLSSGYRINKSMDDVAGLAISENMRGALKGLGQAERNAQDGISFVQVAEGGLSETSNILVRMRELSTQAASDTISDTERGFVNVEVQQLKAEMDRIAQTTEYSGTKLLNGSGKTLDFQIGIRGDENNVITFDAGAADAQAGTLNVDGISVAEKGDARDGLEKLDGAIQKVAEMRASFGAIQSRMSTTVNNIEVYKENLSAANSRIRDADMAEEAANLAKTNVLQQAGTATLAQANMSNNLALKLI